MAAEFDTQPDYTIDDEPPPPPPVREERHEGRGIWGTLAFVVLAAVVLLVLVTQCAARVPDTVGLNRPAAESKLANAGFAVGDVSEVPVGEGRPGFVQEQAPAAGVFARRGMGVDLMIALGADLATVPDVCGLNAANASVKVLRAGFEIENAEEYSDSVPLGIAISQTPVGGSKAAIGSTVIVYHSLGPQSAAEVSVSRTDTDDGLTDADRGTTGSGTDPLIMNCTDVYRGASAWSSGGDIYVRLSPGGSARRVTSTGDWDTAPVISPSHKYLVFLRAPGSGNRATSVGAVCFTSFSTRMLSLPAVTFVEAEPVYYGKPIFAPGEDTTSADTDWIVFPQYWPETYRGDTLTESARLIVCNVPMSSSWVSWNEQFRPAQTLSLSPSNRAGCIRVTQKNGSKRVYSRDFNATTGLYPH